MSKTVKQIDENKMEIINHFGLDKNAFSTNQVTFDEKEVAKEMVKYKKKLKKSIEKHLSKVASNELGIDVMVKIVT